MSIRIDNSADYLERTTDIPWPDITMMAWFYQIVAAPSSYAGPFLRIAEDVGGPWISVGVDYTQIFTIWANDDFYTGSTIDLATWYHISIVIENELIYAYLNGVVDIVAPLGAMTPTRLQIGSKSESGEFLNGRVTAIKFYDAALTENEIPEEMAQYVPFRTEQMNSWIPAVDETAALAAKDYSGFDRHFTIHGTVTVEDGPPIPWRQAEARMMFSLLESAVPQVARPDGDISAGGWTTTTLFSKVDETPSDDGDFITSASAPSNDICELSLSDVDDPLASDGHTLRVRRKKSAASGNTMDMRYRILQGTTEIASWTDDTNISDSGFTAAERTLTTGQADAITDYTNLRVEIRANQVAGSGASPTFNAAGAIAASATSGASITPALPAGFAANDIHIIVCHHSGSVDFNTPSGWTKITALSGTNTSAQIVATFWRRAVGGDTAPAISMASSVNTVRIARCYGFRGCIATGDPWDSGSGAGPTKSNNAASATIATTSITTTVGNCLVLFFGLYEDDPSARTLPSGYTLSGTVGTSALGTDASVHCHRKALTGTGAENPSTVVSGGTFANSVNVGLMIALKPLASPSVAAQVSWVEFEVPGVEIAGTLSVDDTVASWTGTPANGTPITSGSFTPPNSSLLVVAVNGDTGGGPDNITISVSGGSLSWTNEAERDPGDGGVGAGHASLWTAEVATGASMTVAVTRTSGTGGTNRLRAKVYIVSGYKVGDPVGAVGEGSSATANITPNVYTSTADNSRGFGCATDWNQLGLPTSTDTEEGEDFAGAISVVSLYKAADTPTASTVVTANFQAGSAGTAAWNWVAIEILPEVVSVDSFPAGYGGNRPRALIGR